MLFFTSCLVFSSIGIGAIAYKILFAELGRGKLIY